MIDRVTLEEIQRLREEVERLRVELDLMTQERDIRKEQQGVLEAEVERLQAEIKTATFAWADQELRKENERLRAALERIIAEPAEVTVRGECAYCDSKSIARQALEEVER